MAGSSIWLTGWRRLSRRASPKQPTAGACGAWRTRSSQFPQASAPKQKERDAVPVAAQGCRTPTPPTTSTSGRRESGSARSASQPTWRLWQAENTDYCSNWITAAIEPGEVIGDPRKSRHVTLCTKRFGPFARRPPRLRPPRNALAMASLPIEPRQAGAYQHPREGQPLEFLLVVERADELVGVGVADALNCPHEQKPKTGLNVPYSADMTPRVLDRAKAQSPPAHMNARVGARR